VRSHNKSIHIFFGASRIDLPSDQLFGHYKRARAAAFNRSFVANLSKENDTIIKLLSYVQDQSIVRDHVIERLQPLIDVSDEGDHKLLDTLYVYLKNNGNVSNTASQLYIHRNSLRNRINKIEELLSVSLDDAGVRSELFFCYRLYHIYQEMISMGE
jgi:DNA-binding PucR family transcriptional regulator